MFIDTFMSRHVTNALFLGGIGDFFVLTSHVEMSTLRNLYWGARCKGAIDSMIAQCFPHLVHHIVFDSWQTNPPHKGFALASQLPTKNYPADAEEWSPCNFGSLATEDRFSRCPFLTHWLTSIDSIELPRRYFVVQPYTLTQQPGRDYEQQDWDNTIAFLEEKNTPGVVLDISYRDVPQHPLLHNLQRQTTLEQSIEILKYAYGYLGNDSCLSILACQLFPPSRIRIKSKNTFYFAHQHIYCRPQKHFGFVGNYVHVEDRTP